MSSAGAVWYTDVPGMYELYSPQRVMSRIYMPYKDVEERRASNRRSYAKNAEKVKKKNAERKRQYRQEWAEFKSRLSCICCGESHPATLDFHHVVPHKDNRKVHKLVADGAFSAAVEEIKKCVVFCANCHRIFHYDERKREAEASL